MVSQLTVDQLLTTTRAVRKRLDFDRPVERKLIEECIMVAQQAPNGGNIQKWGFMVLTEPEKRAALADLYRKGYETFLSSPLAAAMGYGNSTLPDGQRRVQSSIDYLAENLHKVPVLVIPCVSPRAQGLPVELQHATYGSIMPAAWSFMLAARARNLGTSWTAFHLFYEEEAARLLGIPYDEVMQVALIPVAYSRGTDFKAGPRNPIETVLHWESW